MFRLIVRIKVLKAQLCFKNLFKQQKSTHYSSLYHENELVTDFKKKTVLFNSFLLNIFPQSVAAVDHDPDSIALPKNIY